MKTPTTQPAGAPAISRPTSIVSALEEFRHQLDEVHGIVGMATIMVHEFSILKDSQQAIHVQSGLRCADNYLIKLCEALEPIINAAAAADRAGGL